MIFDSSYIVIILFWIFVLIFSIKEIKYANKLEGRQDKLYIYWTQIILFAGVVIRTIDLSYPFGINTDEAIGGYDAWCLVNYGIDQHLASYPVYFQSWGSGQSALYAYLGMPFIKLFGLSAPVYRIPMALISSFAIIFFYYALNKTTNNKLQILFLILFFVVSPWHIMKSRWALDCNLSPDFLLIGVCLFILGYNSSHLNRRFFSYMLAVVFLSLAAYSYAVSWLMLPIFCLLLVSFLYKKRKINSKEIIYCSVILLIVSLPLILFALNLAFKGEQYQLGAITITALKGTRSEATTLIGSHDLSYTLIRYLKSGVRLLVFGEDYLRCNSFFFYGQFYNILGLPFVVVSLFFIYKRRSYDVLDIVFLLWLISCIPLCIFVDPNVNHWNMIWFPLIYFCGKGLFYCAEKMNRRKYLLVVVVILLFSAFSVKYFSFFREKGRPYHDTNFLSGYEELLDFTKAKPLKEIFINESHSFILFNDPVNPYVYAKTKQLRTGDPNLSIPISYSKYYLYLPHKITPVPGTAYIVRDDKLNEHKIDIDMFNVRKGSGYTLFWNE